MTIEEAGKLLEQSVIVKANPVREVRRSGDYYLKRDFRSSRRLAGEWKAAALLRKKGIPCVPHVAFFPELKLLVTGAMPEALPVHEMIYRNLADWDFCLRFAGFIRKILDAGIRHGDLHVGNVLYSRSTGEFALVDLHGVRREYCFDRLAGRYAMERIFLELRRVLSDEEMLKLLAAGGIADPEDFYRKGLKKEAAFLLREWPRRRRQILLGYPKFTVRRGDRLHCIDLLHEELPHSGTPEPGSRELLLAHFFLQFALIPHREIAGYDRKTETVVWSGRELLPAGRATAGELQRRLRFYGVESDLTDFQSGPDHVAALFNLSKVAAQLPHVKEEDC